MRAFAGSRGASMARRFGVAVALVSAAVLVAFHAVLLWDRLIDGGLFQPMVAARWTASALFVAALAVLRRRNVSVFRGRRALVVCTIVALLHVTAMHPPAAAQAGSDVAQQAALAVFLVPVSAAASVLGAGLLLLSLLRALRLPAPPTRLGFITIVADVPRRAVFRRPLAARPPPLPIC